MLEDLVKPRDGVCIRGDAGDDPADVLEQWPPGRVALPAVESFGQCPCAIRVHRVPASVELGARGLLDR